MTFDLKDVPKAPYGHPTESTSPDHVLEWREPVTAVKAIANQGVIIRRDGDLSPPLTPKPSGPSMISKSFTAGVRAVKGILKGKSKRGVHFEPSEEGKGADAATSQAYLAYTRCSASSNSDHTTPVERVSLNSNNKSIGKSSEDGMHSPGSGRGRGGMARRPLTVLVNTDAEIQAIPNADERDSCEKRSSARSLALRNVLVQVEADTRSSNNLRASNSRRHTLLTQHSNSTHTPHGSRGLTASPETAPLGSIRILGTHTRAAYPEVVAGPYYNSAPTHWVDSDSSSGGPQRLSRSDGHGQPTVPKSLHATRSPLSDSSLESHMTATNVVTSKPSPEHSSAARASWKRSLQSMKSKKSTKIAVWHEDESNNRSSAGFVTVNSFGGGQPKQAVRRLTRNDTLLIYEADQVPSQEKHPVLSPIGSDDLGLECLDEPSVKNSSQPEAQTTLPTQTSVDQGRTSVSKGGSTLSPIASNDLDDPVAHQSSSNLAGSFPLPSRRDAQGQPLPTRDSAQDTPVTAPLAGSGFSSRGAALLASNSQLVGSGSSGQGAELRASNSQLAGSGFSGQGVALHASSSPLPGSSSSQGPVLMVGSSLVDARRFNEGPEPGAGSSPVSGSSPSVFRTSNQGPAHASSPPLAYGPYLPPRSSNLSARHGALGLPVTTAAQSKYPDPPPGGQVVSRASKLLAQEAVSVSTPSLSARSTMSQSALAHRTSADLPNPKPAQSFGGSSHGVSGNAGPNTRPQAHPQPQAHHGPPPQPQYKPQPLGIRLLPGTSEPGYTGSSASKVQASGTLANGQSHTGKAATKFGPSHTGKAATKFGPSHTGKAATMFGPSHTGKWGFYIHSIIYSKLQS
eukprot:gene17987-24400_t